MSLRALSGNLTREQELLERLQFKLEVEQLLLSTGRVDRLHLSTREVEQVLRAIQEAELGRTIEVGEIAAHLGLDPNASLREITEAAPAPWDAILGEQRTSLIRLTTDIQDLTHSNRDLLTSSRRATQETLMSLNDDVRTYGASGEMVAGATGAQLLDQNF